MDLYKFKGKYNEELILSMLSTILSRRQIETFSYFSQKTGFDISCNLSPLETCALCSESAHFAYVRRDFFLLARPMLYMCELRVQMGLRRAGIHSSFR